MRKAVLKSVAVSLAFVLCTTLLVLAESNNSKGTEKTIANTNQKSATNSMDGRILLVVPDKPFTSELAVARSIKTSYRGKEEIAITSESELKSEEKKTANLILILRLNRSKFYEEVLQHFQSTVGKGLIQISHNSSLSDKPVVLISGFDDNGLSAAGYVFKQMNKEELAKTQANAKKVDAGEVQKARKASALDLSIDEYDKLTKAAIAYTVKIGIEAPSTSDAWIFQFSQERKEGEFIAISTFRMPSIELVIKKEADKFIVLSSSVIQENGTRVPVKYKINKGE